MRNVLLALCLGAGAAGFAYSKLGKRVGYGNQQHVWSLVGITFGLVFIMALIVFSLLFSI